MRSLSEAYHGPWDDIRALLDDPERVSYTWFETHVLDAPWTAEAGRFMQREAGRARAAVFRRGGAPSALAEIASLLATALGARPQPERGLLIARAFYDALGGHDEDAADPELDMLRRIGRKRTVTLATTAATQILD